MEEICNALDLSIATAENMQHYYDGIQTALKKGNSKEQIEIAFDRAGLMLSAVAVKSVERCGKELGKDTGTEEILKYLERRYRPHQDRGNLRTRIRNLQESFEEVIRVLKMDMSQKENKELAARKCMSLALECVKAHLFVTVDLQRQEQTGTDKESGKVNKKAEKVTIHG